MKLTIKLNRHYTEIAEEYYLNNYLSYSDDLSSTIEKLLFFNGMNENEGLFVNHYICFNHLVYWKHELK